MDSVSLQNLLQDPRLKRLFLSEDKACAIQLWVLSVKNTEERFIVYGRVVPHSLFNNRWGFSYNKTYQTIGDVGYKLTRLNLFTTSSKTTLFFKLLCAGKTLSEITTHLELSEDKEFITYFGGVSLNASDLVYRPVEYLLNKSSYEKNALVSPHGNAGAVSAVIIQVDKVRLINKADKYSNKLLDFVTGSLNNDTGLLFNRNDKSRLGNIEFLVFPSLNEKEVSQIIISWDKDNQEVCITFTPSVAPVYERYQFLFKLYNLEKLIYSAVNQACLTKNRSYQCRFSVDDAIAEIRDAAEIEIYANNEGKQADLIDRWHMSYVREISFNMHVIGANQQPTKFEWLEKTIKPKQADKVKVLLTPVTNSPQTNIINGRKLDSWVSVDRQFSRKFNQLLPQPSEGQFFLRWGPSDGEGRVQFVEWFKKLFEKYQSYQVVIFDPYFEVVGLRLLNLYSTFKSQYRVFTTQPKVNDNDNERFNNLMKACEENSRQLNKIDLKIYGLNKNKLHDRYILAIDNSGFPVSGFHLSNSLQTVAEKFPLLITPIPQDILLQVESYMVDLIKQSNSSNQEKQSAVNLVFDSQDSEKTVSLYEPLAFLDYPTAGRVLSVWTNQPSLKELHGNALKQELTNIGFLNESSLNIKSFVSDDSFQSWLDSISTETDFVSEWEVAATLLAHSSDTFNKFKNIEITENTLEQLKGYYADSMEQGIQVIEENISISKPILYKKTIDELLNQHVNHFEFAYFSKNKILTWAEYYAVSILWQHQQDFLLQFICKAGQDSIPKELNSTNIKKYAILGHILSQINLFIEFEPDIKLANTLLGYKSGVLQWLGLYALKRVVTESNCDKTFFTAIEKFSFDIKVKYTGWFLVQLKSLEKDGLFEEIVDGLFNQLPDKIDKPLLVKVIDSLRGHMKSLAWNCEWVFNEIINPLLNTKKININEVAEIYFTELTSMLPFPTGASSKLFTSKYEGVFTNLVAFITAFSDADQQENTIAKIEKLLPMLKGIVQQPLASTTNWKKWDSSLTTVKWLESFVLLVEYYQALNDIECSENLIKLQKKLQDITQYKSPSEWNSHKNDLMHFYQQVEQLLKNKNTS